MSGKIVGNYFICKNEVFIEGRSIGPFTSFTTEDSRDNIFGTANIRMPFYTILKEKSSGDAIGKNVKSYIRIDQQDAQIIMGAHVVVKLRYICGFNGYEMPEIVAFDGFVKNVVCGFPTQIQCEDGAFVLRFGTIAKSWTQETAVKTMMQEIIEVANPKFQEYRDSMKLADDWNRLTVDDKSMEGSFVLSTWKGISPFFALERVMGMYNLYSRVDTDGRLYCGVGITENAKETEQLDTSVNVIDRDISINNGFFDKYRVVVKYISGGKLYEYETGADNGEVVSLPYIKCRDGEIAKQVGDAALSGLRTNSNKGTITTMLYPTVRLFDYVQYKDTLFDDLSGGYYVIGHSYRCDENGFHQVLTVTDKTLVFTGQ